MKLLLIGLESEALLLEALLDINDLLLLDGELAADLGDLVLQLLLQLDDALLASLQVDGLPADLLL